MDEREQRANEAQRLLDEPLYQEWLASAEADIVNRLALPATDTDRLEMCLQLRVIRSFPKFLRTVILQKPRPEKARSIA